MFIGKYDKSVVVTFLGTLSAMIGMYFILGYEEPRLTGAMICLIIAGICDMFDGKVARMCKNRTEQDMEYGIQLDSLADMIAFVAFPVVTLYGVSRYFNVALHPIVTVIGVTLFTIGGISRLAYFNLTATKSEPVKYYTGLPVTTTAMIFPLIYLLRYVVSSQVFVSIYLSIFFLVAFLFVYKFKLKKPKKNVWYAAYSIAAVTVISVLIYLRYFH